MDHLVEVDNLTFKRADRIIYDGISLKVPKGKITAVMGPSGIGKTTLLRLIGGQLTPDEGDVRFDGDSIVSMSRKTLYETRRRMSMLFQSGALFTDMSVFDNFDKHFGPNFLKQVSSGNTKSDNNVSVEVLDE